VGPIPVRSVAGGNAWSETDGGGWRSGLDGSSWFACQRPRRRVAGWIGLGTGRAGAAGRIGLCCVRACLSLAHAHRASASNRTAERERRERSSRAVGCMFMHV